MMDQDLQKKLDQINQNLTEINKKSRPGLWRSFFNGTMSGLGSVIGAAIALALVGYILNAIGVIPAFRGEVKRLNSALDQLQKIK